MEFFFFWISRNFIYPRKKEILLQRKYNHVCHRFAICLLKFRLKYLYLELETNYLYFFRHHHSAIGCTSTKSRNRVCETEAAKFNGNRRIMKLHQVVTVRLSKFQTQALLRSKNKFVSVLNLNNDSLTLLICM